MLDFADIPDVGRVLDVGSGTGSPSLIIADRKPGCQVVGVDSSEEYVAYARSSNVFGARVGFEVGDAKRLHFDDATFRSSLSLLTFNFIPNAAKALGEVMRVTEPGGRIAAAVWDYGCG